MTINDLNLDFILQSERITYFNLKTCDFQSLEYKKEIQYLISKHFFSHFDLNNMIETIDISKINHIIKQLKLTDMNKFCMLFKYPLAGCGPGEVLLYYILNSAKICGGSSAGVDIITSCGEYEVKAVIVSPNRYVRDFKLGGTFSLSDIMADIYCLKEELGFKGSEVNKSEIDLIKKTFPNKWKSIENGYKDLSYENYFKNHDIIFMTNNKTSKMGDIVSIKRVSRDDVFIDRVTSGTIKPIVLI